jgi:hypothetical protein
MARFGSRRRLAEGAACLGVIEGVGELEPLVEKALRLRVARGYPERVIAEVLQSRRQRAGRRRGLRRRRGVVHVPTGLARRALAGGLALCERGYGRGKQRRGDREANVVAHVVP